MANDLLNLNWRPKPTGPKVSTPLLATSGRSPRFGRGDRALSQGLFSNLKAFLFEKPVKVSRMEGAPFVRAGYGAGFWENFRELFRPVPAAARHAHSRMAVEWKPARTQFWENLRDLIAPPKMPPLKLSSPPVEVRPIWTKREGLQRAQALSLTFHALLIVLIAVPLVHHMTQDVAPVKASTEIIDISPYLSKLPPGKDKAGGGGGGGERNPVPTTKGRLPRFAMQQLSPPALVRNPNPKLPVEATVIVPPEIKVPNPAMPNYGDPLASIISNSQGPGSGGGFGTGSGGGVGSGSGGGVGPGTGGGIGGGAFRAGAGGVGYASCAYCPQPKYTEEARKAKLQGVVLLRVIITPDGRATNIQVVKGLGLGLDEEAIRAVKEWRFKPSLGPDGRPIPAWNTIEVNFRLL